MKTLSALLVPLALLAGPALGEPANPSTLSGTMTLKVVPPAPADAKGEPQATETVTLRIERPAAVDEDEEAKQRDLETCGKRWNAKLKAYREKQAKNYRAYWEKWKDSSAQRPPTPIILTRLSYRQCMADCLERGSASCPGGWPEETR